MARNCRPHQGWLALRISGAILAGLVGCHASTPSASHPDRPAEALLRLPVAERVTVAERLGTPGPGAAAAIPVLIDLLDAQDDRDLRVHAAAVASLARLGPEAVPALLAALDRPGDEAADRLIFLGAHQALTQMGPEVIPTLLERLGDPKAGEGLRSGVVQAIEDRRPPEAAAVPVLVRILEQEPDVTRLRALVARCLGALGPAAEPAIPTLVRLMAEAPDPRNETQFAFDAMTALGRIGPGAAPALTELAGQARGAARFRAARALAETGPEGAHAAIPVLIELVEDPGLHQDDGDGWIVLDDALTLLGQYRSRPELAVPALVRQLDDPEGLVRGTAVAALAEYGPLAEPAIARLVALLADDGGHPESPVSSLAMTALARIGPKAVPALVGALTKDNESTRLLAAGALGQIQAMTGADRATAIPALIAATRDPAAVVAESAATALGDLHAAEAVPALLAVIEADPTEPAAAAAVHALGSIGPPAAAPAVPKLLALARARDRSLGLAALSVLPRLGPEPRAEVIAALRSPTADVRSAAAAGLGRAGADAADALPALRALANDPVPEVRGAAGRALQLISEAAASAPR